MHAYIYTYTYIYMHICVCVLHICIHIYIHIYICIHSFTCSHISDVPLIDTRSYRAARKVVWSPGFGTREIAQSDKILGC